MYISKYTRIMCLHFEMERRRLSKTVWTAPIFGFLVRLNAHINFISRPEEKWQPKKWRENSRKMLRIYSTQRVYLFSLFQISRSVFSFKYWGNTRICFLYRDWMTLLIKLLTSRKKLLCRHIQKPHPTTFCSPFDYLIVSGFIWIS